VTDIDETIFPETAGGVTAQGETAGEAYKRLLTQYRDKKRSPVWSAGFGPAAAESQRLTEEARSARGGLGAFQQPSFLEQLTGAANAAAGGMGEERTRRKAIDYAMSKELAGIEAGEAQTARDIAQTERENIRADKELGLQLGEGIKHEAPLLNTMLQGTMGRLGYDLGTDATPEELINNNNFSQFTALFANRIHHLYPEKDNTAKYEDAVELAAMLAPSYYQEDVDIEDPTEGGENPFNVNMARILDSALKESQKQYEAGKTHQERVNSTVPTYEFFLTVYDAFQKKHGERTPELWKAWNAFVEEKEPTQ